MENNIIFMLLGLGLLGFGIYKAYQAWTHKRWIDNARDWPITTGTVDHTRVRYRQQGRGQHYYAVIEYSYKIMGSKYGGDIKKDNIWGNKGSANKIVALYPEKRICQVRYNPINPELHVVDFDTVGGYEIFTTAAFTIVGLILLISGAIALRGG